MSVPIITIKNGLTARNPVIFIKYSKFSYEFLNRLWDEGFILGYAISVKNRHKMLKLYPKYKYKESVLETLQSVSKIHFQMKKPLKLLWKNPVNRNTTLSAVSYYKDAS